MEKPIVDFKDFKLSFIDTIPEFHEENFEPELNEIPNNLEKKKAWLKAAIPRDAIFLGTIENTIMSGMVWDIEEHFYLIPLKEGSFDWALFRLYWDDGEENWEWAFDARLKGLKDQPLDAARLMISAFWEAIGIDLEDSEEEFRKEFIKNLLFAK